MDKKKTKKDQEKQNHREAMHGHRTKKHWLNEIHMEEAEEEIEECKLNDLKTI